MTLQAVAACPFDHTRDERKSARVATRSDKAAASVHGFEPVRSVLRNDDARQAGFKAELVERFKGMARPPILYLHGEAHRRQRAGTARFFAPKVVATRYRAVMDATSERLVTRLERDGHADLDALALEMAVTVAADVVGLTNSNVAGMSSRLDAFFSTAIQTREGRLAETASFVLGQWRMLHFYLRDVRPAIAARRKTPGEDVISHLLAEGYTAREILTECFTYGAAGMVTTREFITMAGWHLFERPDLAATFVAADEPGKLEILDEILRLEPVVGTLFRRMGDYTVALGIRSANTDTRAVGECPMTLNPDRIRAPKVAGAGLAFGDGEHRCPGASVAMHEAAVFLDRLLRVPGLKMDRPPTLGWNPLITGYELRNCRLRID